MIDHTKDCPCGAGQQFAACCGRFITHRASPENAVQLMRSRYTAYVLGDVDYLKTTWHADYRLHDLSLDAGLRWLGLEVIAAPAPVGDQASVEFEARLLVGAQVNALHEHSRFTRVDGQWLYTNGEALEPTFKPWKPGRNEACPCGSGLKFKRCCGR